MSLLRDSSTGADRSLVRDQSGAMMVMGLFMALFMIGSLYYILGVGDAVIFRRLMQDGSDAGSFAASVTAAKGMNLIVLFNIIMAILVGILMLIRIIEWVLFILGLILMATVYKSGRTELSITATASPVMPGPIVFEEVPSDRDPCPANLDPAPRWMGEMQPSLAFREGPTRNHARSVLVKTGTGPEDVPRLDSDSTTIGTPRDRLSGRLAPQPRQRASMASWPPSESPMRVGRNTRKVDQPKNAIVPGW